MEKAVEEKRRIGLSWNWISIVDYERQWWNL